MLEGLTIFALDRELSQHLAQLTAELSHGETCSTSTDASYPSTQLLNSTVCLSACTCYSSGWTICMLRHAHSL